ncbi:MAG: DUF4190 domain-containing protein [Blastocatellia bacterium]|nr:DUF4190 domain-containing protein [Blastocatellia bacterium]
MKRCPTCEKTFDDNLRFCQVDGTPLVEEEESLDPFKTMVGRPGEFAAALKDLEVSKPEEEPPVKEEEVLELPEDDPNKTMIASEAEIRAEMNRPGSSAEDLVDLPPIGAQPPEPPRFNEPSPPPPSPFNAPPSAGEKREEDSKTSPPIRSPFGEKPPTMSAPSSSLSHQPDEKGPDLPQRDFQEPPAKEPSINPFDTPPPPAAVGGPMSQADRSPGVKESKMQNPNNAPFTPPGAPPAAAAGQSQVLAIVSLVLGILSLLCCNWFVVGIAAIITGFMARSKAKSDPVSYGGAGLATVGLGLGAASLLLGVVIWVLYMMGFAASLMQGNF